MSQYQPDLVCLPECAFTGYLYDEQDFEKFAEPIPGQITAKISVLAKQYNCYICFGLLEKTPHGTYDAAVLVDRAGEICLVHRKNFEHRPFINGDQVNSVDTEFGRMAILLCGDLFNDEVQAKIRQPLTALLLPMSRSFDGKSPDLERWVNEERQTYLDEVKKLGVTTLMVNSLVDSHDDASFGGAMIVNAGGELLAESLHGTDEALIFDLDVA